MTPGNKFGHRPWKELMTLVDIVGWLAAAFTLAAYSMRTMVPLRIAAIGANVAFITFGALDATLPILALHTALLPFNGYRLWEILRGIRAARAARGTDPDFSWLRDVATPTAYRDGAHVFRKGDPPSKLYYIDSLGRHALRGPACRPWLAAKGRPVACRSRL